MATIELTHPHSLPQTEIKRRVEAFIQAIKSEFNIEYQWEGDHKVSFKATSGMVKGVSGVLWIKESSVKADVDLPLFLRPLKNVVEAQIHAKLQDNLKS